MFICPIYTTFTPRTFLTWRVSSYPHYYFCLGCGSSRVRCLPACEFSIPGKCGPCRCLCIAFRARIAQKTREYLCVAFGARIAQELCVCLCVAFGARITQKT